jgi:hypothetical protein
VPSFTDGLVVLLGAVLPVDTSVPLLKALLGAFVPIVVFLEVDVEFNSLLPRALLAWSASSTREGLELTLVPLEF